MSTNNVQRKKQLAMIHVARQQLRLDDDTYRAMLHKVAGVESAADLDARGRDRVLRHFRSLGWESKATRRPQPSPDRAALVRKIRAQLIAAGNRPDSYADAMARHMFKVDRFEWLAVDQLQRLVAALAYDAKRHGREV